MIRLDMLTMNLAYRTRGLAWEIYNHERRREAMGKRGHVTADECFSRAWRRG